MTVTPLVFSWVDYMNGFRCLVTGSVSNVSLSPRGGASEMHRTPTEGHYGRDAREMYEVTLPLVPIGEK